MGRATGNPQGGSSARSFWRNPEAEAEGFSLQEFQHHFVGPSG